MFSTAGAATKGYSLTLSMLSRRPVQYLGLLLLVLASLFVIFFPVGSAPQEQTYTVARKAPKPFAELVGKPKDPKKEPKKDPVQEADKAFNTQFETNKER